MNQIEIKSHKDRLRQINSHLSFAHNEMGVERDAVGFVEVVHHPTNILPSFNYVTPRRKTALVPGTHIEEGIGALRDYRRDVRVQYIDDLFPAFFSKSLDKIGLRLQGKHPLWVFDLPSAEESFQIPSSLSANVIVNEDGLNVWKLIWRDANYRFFTTPLEPMLMGKHYPHQSKVLDIVLYHHDTPIAVARATIYNKTAHLMARAVMQSTQPLRLHQLLIQASLQAVSEYGCDFMFVCDREFEQDLMGLSDLSCQLEGNMLFYSDNIDHTHGKKNDDTVEQPVLLT